MDPYEILDLPRNFTYDMLRDQYKSMAKQTHPDKSGLKSDYLFKLVTAAYLELKKELEMRISDPSFHDLKHKSQSFVADRRDSRPENMGSGSGFNLDRFNKIFDDNRIEDETSDGYGNWMAESSAQREDIEIPNKLGKFDNNVFNKTFDNIKPSGLKQIVKYKEPEALPAAKNIAFSELGVANITDFSGENMDHKRISYSDYKLAHSRQKLVDFTVKQRKEYENLKQLEADRANVSYQMTDKEQRDLAKKKTKEEALEKKRIARMKWKDQQVANQYEKLNRLLLGR